MPHIFAYTFAFLASDKALNTNTATIRIILAVSFVFGLHFYTGYHSMLISALTNPIEPTHMSTSKELFDSNIIMKGKNVYKI